MEKSERNEKRDNKETNSKNKHSSASSDSDSDSPSDSSADSAKFRKEMKKLKKKIKKEERKTARRLKKKLKSEKRKQEKAKKITDKFEKNNAKLLPIETPMESVPLVTEKSSNIPIGLMERAKIMAPMTKEEWEKRQSVVRKVLDEESGRYRLIKGDGEVLEEIVCQKRHKEINKQATLADGAFFQTHMRRK